MTKFKLEDRYVVVKVNDLNIFSRLIFEEFMRDEEIETRNCVVVESDWDIYPAVVKMVENLWEREQGLVPNYELGGDANGWPHDCHCANCRRKRELREFARMVDKINTYCYQNGIGELGELYSDALIADHARLKETESELKVLRSNVALLREAHREALELAQAYKTQLDNLTQ